MSQATKIHSTVDVEKRKKLGIRAGDTVRVSVKIEEKGKTRTQEFEGLVLARKHGNEPGATFTVRRTTGGVGVEKIFPLFSPVIEKITIVKRSKVRQANLYHIRKKATKEVRRYIRNIRNESQKEDEIEEKKETSLENETVLKDVVEEGEKVKVEKVDQKIKEQTDQKEDF